MENKLIQIFFDDVMCFVDMENKEIWSAKHKKLKPQHLKKHLSTYYMIKYNGKKAYKSLEQLMALAMEQKAYNEENKVHSADKEIYDKAWRRNC